MPPLRFRRNDLSLRVEGDEVFVSAGGRIAHTLHIDSSGRVPSGLARSAAWKRWRAAKPRGKWPVLTLPRVTLDIRASEHDCEAWEREIFRLLKRHSTRSAPAVVRTSPVRARCESVPFTLPLRIVEVNAEPTMAVGSFVQSVFGRKPPLEYATAVKVDSWEWPTWGPASSQTAQGADVLHIHRLPPVRPGNLLSGDPRLTGGLGWFAERCLEWNVRLLVLCESAGWPLEDLLRLASALVSRGGPAVAVEGFDRSRPRAGYRIRKFYGVLYEQLIHDYPIDWAWWRALNWIKADPFNASLWVGAAREDQLRSSTIGLRLFKFLEPDNARARKAWFELAFEKPIRPDTPMRPGLRPKGQDEGAGTAHRVEAELVAIRQIWPKAQFNLHESDGMMPLGRVLDRARRQLDGRPTIGELIAATIPAPRKPLERFVNCSFSVEQRDGSLKEVAQETGLFARGRIYHLGVQVGPRTGRVLTVNETALIEEPFVPAAGADGVWVEIGVTAIDVDVIGDPVQRVWLPMDKSLPTEVVYFAVRLNRRGINRLRVALYYEQNVMQSFRIGVVAARPQGRAAALADGLGIKPRQSLDVSYLPVLEFSLASSIDRFAQEPARPERALAIIANEWNGESIITVKGASKFTVNVSNRLAGCVDRLQKALLSISNLDAPNQPYPFAVDSSGTVAQLEQALRTLADRGRALFVELFDSSDWSAIAQELGGGDDRPIQVANILREKVIPWSLVYDRSLTARSGNRDAHGNLVAPPVCLAALPDASGKLPVKDCMQTAECLLTVDPNLTPGQVVCPLHFWGFRHSIECPPQQKARPQRNARKPSQRDPGVIDEIPTGGAPVALVSGVNSTFDSEEPHFKALARLATKYPLAPLEKEYTATGLMRRLAKPPLHIAYFFCHAEGAAGAEDSQVILQAPDTDTPERILWREFAEIFEGKKRWDPPALVFLNGCRTANYSPEALSPFLRSFVDQLGASGLIGTEITVWDLFAAEMGKAFFEAFLNGTHAGAALVHARRVLLSRRNPLGLVYTLHASADLHLS